MNEKHYKQFEKTVCILLFIGCAGFIVYLILAAADLALLGLFGILTIAVSALGLWLLYANRELFRSRSLWLSCAFFALIACTLASLILSYP